MQLSNVLQFPGVEAALVTPGVLWWQRNVLDLSILPVAVLSIYNTINNPSITFKVLGL